MKSLDPNGILMQHGEDELRRRFDEACTTNGAAHSQQRRQERTNDDGGSSPTRLYQSRCIGDIVPEPINWLWHRRLALGKLGLFAGEPGVGKSQVTALMAATVSTGRNWPDDTPSPRGSVVIVSCEDDAADTIRPRLEALNADLSRIHILDWVERIDREGKRSRHLFDLGQDIGVLASMVRDIGDVALVDIDPVSAYLGELDSHKTSDVRSALAPLQELASKSKAAMVLVSHLNKGTADASAMARVSGSGAFVAACRSAWLIGCDPQDQRRERRILAPLKNNIGDDRTGFAFRVESVALPCGIETSRVVFELGSVEISPFELLRGKQETDEERGALGEAEDFLRDYLAVGQQNAKAATKAAKDAGISERTLRRARERLGVKVMKSKVTGSWVWGLPEQPANPG